MRAARIAIAWFATLALAPTQVNAGGTTVEVGRFTPYRESVQPDITLAVRRGQTSPKMNGATLACFDENAIQSVHFWGLQKPDLERLRKLIDETIAELE